MKKVNTSPIGLHLSSRAARLMQLAGKPGERKVHAMATCLLPHDEDASSEEIDRETTSILRELIADHPFQGNRVVSCLGSQELIVQIVQLPDLPPGEVDAAVLREAEERLPYLVNDAEIRHILAGQVQQETNVKQEVLLLACHRGVIQRHLNLLEQVGLIPASIDVEPCAILRSLRLADRAASSDERVAYLSFDVEATTVMFADGDQIQFLKYLHTGSHHLDVAISRHLNLGIAEAAKIRATVTEASELNFGNGFHRSVIDAIRDPLESIVDEFELCMRYYKETFRGSPLTKMVLTGREASRWLVSFLSERFGIPCEARDPFDAIENRPEPISSDNSRWKWTTAIGLSMKHYGKQHAPVE